MTSRVWTNWWRNFDTIGNAYMILFEVASLDAWSEVMYATMDITGKDSQPEQYVTLQTCVSLSAPGSPSISIYLSCCLSVPCHLALSVSASHSLRLTVCVYSQSAPHSLPHSLRHSLRHNLRHSLHPSQSAPTHSLHLTVCIYSQSVSQSASQSASITVCVCASQSASIFRNATWENAFFFLAFIFFASLFMLQLLISVVIEIYEKETGLLQGDQQEFADLEKLTLYLAPTKYPKRPAEGNTLQRIAYDLCIPWDSKVVVLGACYCHPLVYPSTGPHHSQCWLAFSLTWSDESISF